MPKTDFQKEEVDEFQLLRGLTQYGIDMNVEVDELLQRTTIEEEDITILEDVQLPLRPATS